MLNYQRVSPKQMLFNQAKYEVLNPVLGYPMVPDKSNHQEPENVNMFPAVHPMGNLLAWVFEQKLITPWANPRLIIDISSIYMYTLDFSG